MSFQAMAWAVKQKVGNATGKAILLTLANYADEHGQCFPSQERIAKDCECSKRSVLDWLQKFEKNGLLTRVRRHSDGGYRRADLLCLNLGAAFSRENISGENASNPRCSTFTAEPVIEPPVSTSLRSVDKRSPRQELETVLDAEHAKDVIEHRNRIRKPMTAKAAKMLANKLSRFPDPNAAADLMIEKGWQSIELEWVENARAKLAPRNSDRMSLGDAMRELMSQQDGQDGPFKADDRATLDGDFRRIPAPVNGR